MSYIGLAQTDGGVEGPAQFAVVESTHKKRGAAMKNILMALAVAAGLCAPARAELKAGVEIDKTAQAASFNHDIEPGGYERFSMQMDYAAASPSAATVSDGQFSTATITVVDYAKLATKRSSTTITLGSGKNTAAAIGGAYVTLKGTRFTEGVDWNRNVTYSTMTAKSLSDAIDAHHEFTTYLSSNIITVYAQSSGTYFNGWAVASSTPAALAISSSAFEGGQDHAYISINGTTLTEGTDWDAATSNAATAISLGNAINNNAVLVLIASAAFPTSGVVSVHSQLSGLYPYPISVLDATNLLPNYYRMVNGAASDVSVADNTFYEASHGYSDGLALLLATVSGTAPTGLTAQTTYYAKPVDANYFKVSASSSTTGSGTAVDITAVTGGGSFTFTPLTFATKSQTGFKWQGSNDASTYYDLDMTSVTYAAAAGAVWSFYEYPYRYLRFKFTGPQTGGITLKGTFSGRK